MRKSYLLSVMVGFLLLGRSADVLFFGSSGEFTTSFGGSDLPERGIVAGGVVQISHDRKTILSATDNLDTPRKICLNYHQATES